MKSSLLSWKSFIFLRKSYIPKKGLTSVEKVSVQLKKNPCFSLDVYIVESTKIPDTLKKYWQEKISIQQQLDRSFNRKNAYFHIAFAFCSTHCIRPTSSVKRDKGPLEMHSNKGAWTQIKSWFKMRKKFPSSERVPQN